MRTLRGLLAITAGLLSAIAVCWLGTFILVHFTRFGSVVREVNYPNNRDSFSQTMSDLGRFVWVNRWLTAPIAAVVGGISARVAAGRPIWAISILLAIPLSVMNVVWDAGWSGLVCVVIYIGFAITGMKVADRMSHALSTSDNHRGHDLPSVAQ